MSGSRNQKLPNNMLREVAARLSPRNQRAIRSATSPYTRKTLPIGLAVTKVETVIPKSHQVIVRSMSSAKAISAVHTSEPIDRIVPAAYKNPHWKYYVVLTTPVSSSIIFKNTPNGQPYIINRKTGTQRTNSGFDRTLRYYEINMQNLEDPRVPWKTRKTKHTWQEYLKRLNRTSRTYYRGAYQRKSKEIQMTNNIRKYSLGENTKALNKWSFGNLMWWSKRNIISLPLPYVKRNGKYYRHGQGYNHPITKNNLIKSISNSFYIPHPPTYYPTN